MRLPGKIDRDLVLLVLLLLAGTLAYFTAENYNRQVGGVAELDGYYYYIYLRSLQVDGDLDFGNEYQQWGNQFGFGKSPTGYHRNIFGIGPALLWAPFFLLTHLLALLGVKLGYPLSTDGMSRFHQVGTFYGTMIYGWIGLVLTYSMARRCWGRRHALWPALGAALAGPLPCYVLTLASYSHAQAAMATSLLVLLWIRWRDAWTLRRWIIFGAATGLVMLIRPACGPFVLLPLLEGVRAVVPSLRARRWRTAARALLPPMAGAGASLLVFSPQLVVWKILFGTYLTVPQGEGFMIWSESAWVSTLFSPRNGLLTMAPLMALALLGLLGACVRQTRTALPLLLVFIGMAVINGMAHDWWGWGFSARRFSSTLPILAYGLAAALVGVRKLLEKRPVRSIAWVTSTVVLLAVVVNLQWVFNYTQKFMTWTNLRSSETLYMTVLHSLVDKLFRTTGNPMSLPGSLPFTVAKGGTPQIYDKVDGHYLLGESHSLANPSAKPYANATMALSDLKYRYHLSDSFGNPIKTKATTYVPLRGRRGHVFIPVNRIGGMQMRIGLRAHHSNTRLEARFNNYVLGKFRLPGDAWGMVSFMIPAHIVEQGINRLDVIHHLPRGWDAPGSRLVGTTSVRSPVDIAVVSGGLTAGNFTEIWVQGRKVSSNGRGLNLAVVDPRSGQVLGTRALDVVYRPALFEEMNRYLRTFPAGSIVALGARDNCGRHFAGQGRVALAAMGAAFDLARLERTGYVALGVLGAPPGTADEATAHSGHARVHVGRPPPPWREIAQYRVIQVR